MFRTFCKNCLLKSSKRQLIVFPRFGYRSKANIEYLYPDSNPDFLRDNDYKARNPGFEGYIPIEKLEICATKGSGPGGQRVNKVNNNVQVKFHVDSAEWIPDEIKERFVQQQSNRMSKDGFFHTSSHRTREQHLNQADCLDKIRTAVFQAMEEPKLPTEKDLKILEERKEKKQRQRLRQKRAHSMKKEARSSSADF